MRNKATLITIYYSNGLKDGIANPRAIQVIFDAMIKEIDRQIEEC